VTDHWAWRSWSGSDVPSSSVDVGVDAEAAVGFPSLAAPPLDRTRTGRWGVAAVNLVTLATGPHLPFMALRDGAHQPRHWAGRPRSGREIRAQTWPLGQVRWRST
jgi:hypothetical protein